MFENCTLTATARAEFNCSPRKCYRCGWNADEIERRNRQIETKGLTLCEDGLHRLVIRREEPVPETREAEQCQT